MFKVAVIDDESSAREIIALQLKRFSDKAMLVGEADSVSSGIKLVNEKQPDVLLLDINLKDGTGFDLLRELDQIRFKLIFVTAYDRFALKAIKFSALDYLLKPIDSDEFQMAMKKAFLSLESENQTLKLNAFLNNFTHINQEARKIVLNTANSIYLINVRDIVRCQAENNQTLFILANGEQILASKTLKEFDELLSDYQFIRIHKSHLVNLNYIDRFDKSHKLLLILKDKSIVPVALRRKEELLSKIQKI